MEKVITQKDIIKALAEKFKVNEEDIELNFEFDRKHFENTYSENESIKVEAIITKL